LISLPWSSSLNLHPSRIQEIVSHFLLTCIKLRRFIPVSTYLSAHLTVLYMPRFVCVQYCNTVMTSSVSHPLSRIKDSTKDSRVTLPRVPLTLSQFQFYYYPVTYLGFLAPAASSQNGRQ
jgi:hypothetical protein